MASMFRPPESRRTNSKPPKLSLPPQLVSNSKPITDIRDEKLRQPPSKSVPSSATPTSSASASSARTLKNRPVPPPTASSVTPLSSTNSGSAMGSLSNKLHGLKINTDHLPTSGSQQSTQSADSMTSNLISMYDSEPTTSSSTSLVNHGKESEIIEHDRDDSTDELESDIWQTYKIHEQIDTLGILGEGTGGSVTKCKLRNGSKIFALKTIATIENDGSEKQIFRELQFNKSCKSDFIVRYYGMFACEETSTIFIAMEYMGGRSLDSVYKHLLSKGGRIGEKVLGKIAESVLRGLFYLHERKIIHRDIKPQNILFNEIGQIKLCDFGVSGEAVNSLATTFTGTSYYMAPERIQGQPYSVTSDVWSLGLTLLEVAQGHSPFDTDKLAANMPPIELLMLILTFTPELKDEPEQGIVWSKSFKSFLDYSLKKDSKDRPSPRQMLQHPWMVGQTKKHVNMKKFIQTCWAD
ncbi:mitogen-activated protein kinase kinase MKK1 [Kluyveromyces lactis]|uniref:KLLA0D07304p n=1 Tax=Kluyveromyces lactis (strain ATCC 8585 / CBS 2359 / DSM 70799 / NBRC 1267 / NRRL Y-1140 / WM37) TaxID=284590 RepID=Q6CRQ2_KLULA|nr:uncharacterized protein KLLA0_D07304g [Kluyveromyces lactis]CAH00483.1 KLLA0D07304p [Kluyveromyces lactis]|eukprot:XP_453387.1 uncharacterized protein KLLA0_D07304g [Kluyveromyces lactis]